MKLLNTSIYIGFSLAAINLCFSCPCCPKVGECAAVAAPISHKINIKLDLNRKPYGYQVFVQEKCEPHSEEKTDIITGNISSSFNIFLCNKEELIDSIPIENDEYIGKCIITNRIKCSKQNV